jgi:predicted  nucleic acid-binding Zn ribbon protein
MKIIVNSINIQNSVDNQSIMKSKEVICPKCGYSIRIKIKDYKISLYDCKNSHIVDNLQFDEFEKLKL